MVTIGVSLFWIGLLEGIIEAISFFMKLFSGVLSDYFRKRKSIILVGYGCAILSMLLTGLASGYKMIFMARSLGRIGNGIQATPRDALVGDVAPEDKIGSSFGLMRSLGVLGSIIGSFVGVLAMMHTNNNFNTVFYMATIPAICAFALLFVGIKEPKLIHIEHVKYYQDTKKTSKTKAIYPIHLYDLKRLGNKFWFLILIISIFMFAKFSEQWMTLVAFQKFDLSKEYTPFVSMAFCATYCLSSYPIGLLSDKIGRFPMFIFAILVLMLGDIVIAYANSLPLLYVGILLLGCQTGIAQNTFAALITDIAPKNILGTAFGIYYFFSGLATVGAGIFG
jgi:MFS family permease